MKKFAACIALVTAGTLIAPIAPAAATPPDIINVRDEVLGISDRSIYILRQTDDNLGVYQSSLSDVYLIAIDRSGGLERRWPVYRVRNDTNDKGRVTNKTELLRGSVNPYDILAHEKALVLTARDWQQDGKVEVKPDGVHVSYGGKPLTQFGPTILPQMVTSALNRMANTIPNYPRLAPVKVKDLMAGQKFSDAECTYSEPIYYPATNANVFAGLLRVTCENDGQTSSLLMPVINEPIIVAGD